MISTRCAKRTGCRAIRRAPRANTTGWSPATPARPCRTLTGGMCWEALNNIAAAHRPVIIVVNDNGRSYAPTIGGFADHLAGLRLQPGYERILEEGRKAVRNVPLIGELCYQCMHSVKAGIKD